MKTGLVLEGGALRAIFSSGVCDGLLDGKVMADYVVGVSAGIAYGVSYLSGQPRRNLEVVTRYAPDRRYMGMNNLADKRNRCYFGLKFAYDTIPNKLVPFDYDAFAASPPQGPAGHGYPGQLRHAAAFSHLSPGWAALSGRGRGGFDPLEASSWTGVRPGNRGFDPAQKLCAPSG